MRYITIFIPLLLVAVLSGCGSSFPRYGQAITGDNYYIPKTVKEDTVGRDLFVRGAY